MAKSNISLARKKQLDQPDEFITVTSKVLDTLLKKKKQIALILAGIVILILSVSGSHLYLNKLENDAFTALAKSANIYRSEMDTNDDIEKTLQAVEKEFVSLATDYSSRVGGKMATLILANLYYTAKKPQEAIKMYKNIVDEFDNQELNNIVLNGLAYSYEAVGDFKNAIHYFEMIASENNSAYLSDAIYNLGRLYDQQGNGQKSNEYFQKLSTDHKDSIYNEIAKEKMSVAGNNVS